MRTKKSFFLLFLLSGAGLFAQTVHPTDTISSDLYLDEFVITSAIRANERSAVAFTDLSAAELSRVNLGQDIPFLLMLTPSFVATSETGTGIGYTGFRIRGTDASRINVTINGIPFNDPQSHGVFFVNIPDMASSLSSVQVQRGVGTSTHGAAAFGASINMQTNHAQPLSFAELECTLGSFNTSKYTVRAGSGLINNRWAIEGRVSGIQSDGYVDRAFTDMQSYLFSGGFYGDNTTLKFITFGGQQKTGLAWDGVDLDMVRRYPHLFNRRFNALGIFYDDDGNRQYYDNQLDHYTQFHNQLHLHQRFSRNLNLNAALHYTRGFGYFEEYRQRERFNRYNLTPAAGARSRTDLIRQRWLDNHFFGTTFSLNYNSDNNRIQAILGGAANRFTGDHFGKVLWVREPVVDFNPDDDWYRNHAIKDDISIFGKINAELIRGLFASVDLQYRYIMHDMEGIGDRFVEQTGELFDITQTHRFHFFNPKFGLMYQPTRNHQIYASFSIANREPYRRSFVLAAEGERPRSERLYNTEIGYRFLSPRFSAGANLYYMHYRDQMVLTGRVSEIGQPLTVNVPESFRAGIELTAGWKVSDNLRWDGNLTFSRSRILNFTENVDAWDAHWNPLPQVEHFLGTTDIAYSPNVIANSLFTFNHRGFEMALQSFYVGRQFFDNTSSHSRSIDPYFVNNLSLRYTLPLENHLRAVDFRVLVNNLFNVDYSSNAYGWSYYVGGVRHDHSRFFVQAGTNFLASVTMRF